MKHVLLAADYADDPRVAQLTLEAEMLWLRCCALAARRDAPIVTTHQVERELSKLGTGGPGADAASLIRELEDAELWERLGDVEYQIAGKDDLWKPSVE